MRHYFRLGFLFVCTSLNTLLLPSDCLSLKRDFCGSPYLCREDTLRHYKQNTIAAKDLVLIPGLSQNCEQVCCRKCGHAYWMCWAKEDWEVQDEDEEELGFCKCSWNCSCKETDMEDINESWDASLSSWVHCTNQALYPGYFQARFAKYRRFLIDHLEYVKSTKSPGWTWPELSSEAAAISNTAYSMLHHLLKTTPMKILVTDLAEQSHFLSNVNSRLNTHGVTIALTANCFFFSHYDHVLKDLEAYSRDRFNGVECLNIAVRLDEIRTTLYPLFLNLYDKCIKRQHDSRIENERMDLVDLNAPDSSDCID